MSTKDGSEHEESSKISRRRDEMCDVVAKSVDQKYGEKYDVLEPSGKLNAIHDAGTCVGILRDGCSS